MHYYQNMINDASDFVTRSVQTMNNELTAHFRLFKSNKLWPQLLNS